MDIWMPVSYLLVCIVTCAARKSSSEFFLNADAFSSEHVMSTSRRLSELMHMQCLPDRILVTFGRTSMLGMGILPGQVSFDNSRCDFISNATHYRGRVMFRGPMCGSMYNVDSLTKVHTINNSVVFSPPTGYSSGEYLSLDDEDEYGSGSGDGEETEVSDLHIINIPFICKYTSPTESTTSRPEDPLDTSQVTKIRPSLSSQVNNSFIMELYDDSRFLNPLVMAYTVSVGSILYVQIEPRPGSKYEKSFLHNCYYVAQGSHKLPTTYLIRNGCPIEPSVTFYDDSKEGGKRLFSFKVHKFHEMQTSLRCELQPCSLDESVPTGLPRCGSQMSYCTSRVTDVNEMITVTWAHTLHITSLTSVHTESMGCVKQIEVPCDCLQTDGSILERTGTKMEVKLWIVILIAIAASLIGALSVVALWCVHSRTDSKHNMMSMPSQEPQSTDSDPSVHCKLMNQPPTATTQVP